MADRIFAISNAMMKGTLRIFSNWQVTGQENVPLTGPLLIVSNHMSNVDPPLVAASIPRRVNFIAKRGIFKPGIRWFLKAYGAFALKADKEGNDIEAMLWMRKLLRQNKSVVIFPESTRNPYVGMQQAVPGVALLASKTQTPILPVGITGTERLGPLWRIVFPTGDLRVHIGKPFTLPDTGNKYTHEQLKEMMYTVMGHIADLLPKNYHGVYKPSTPSPELY